MKKLGMFVMVMAVLAAVPAFADDSTKPATTGQVNSKIPCTSVVDGAGAKTQDSAQSQDQQTKSKAAEGK